MLKQDNDGLSRVEPRWRMNRVDMSQAGAGIWRAFATAVIRGAVAAAMLPTAFIMVMLIASLLTNPIDVNNLLAAIGLLLLPFAVALLVIAVSSVLIGLPVTVALRRARLETAFNYTLAGGASGCAVPLIWGAITPAGRLDVTSALLGLVGGAVTAHAWWKNARSKR